RLGYRFDARGIQPGQERGHASAPGDERVRRDVRQRHQGEGALVQARVRDLQAGRVDHRLAIQQQVQVETARTPARGLVATAVAAVALFDREQGGQQRLRGESR